MTKKIILWVSLVGFAIYAALYYFHNALYDYCVTGGYCWKFWESLDIIGAFLFFFPVLFIFSLITYKLRDEVFQSWLGFTKWWIPLSMFLVLIMPDGQSGGYMPSLIDKQVIAFLMVFIFTLVSLIKIIYKSIKLRGK